MISNPTLKKQFAVAAQSGASEEELQAIIKKDIKFKAELKKDKLDNEIRSRLSQSYQTHIGCRSSFGLRLC